MLLSKPGNRSRSCRSVYSFERKESNSNLRQRAHARLSLSARQDVKRSRGPFRPGPVARRLNQEQTEAKGALEPRTRTELFSVKARIVPKTNYELICTDNKTNRTLDSSRYNTVQEKQVIDVSQARREERVT